MHAKTILFSCNGPCDMALTVRGVLGWVFLSAGESDDGLCQEPPPRWEEEREEEEEGVQALDGEREGGREERGSGANAATCLQNKKEREREGEANEWTLFSLLASQKK